MLNSEADPLFGDPPTRVQLNDAPLHRVLAQVHYPSILSISDQKYVSHFQNAIRQDYPGVSEDVMQSAHFDLTDGSKVKSRVDKETVWRFYSKDTAWRVSLARDSISIETLKYSDRQEFVSRLQHVAASVQEHIRPSGISAIGFRYINVFKGEHFKKLSKYVRPEILGLYKGGLDSHLEVSTSSANMKTEEGNLIASWGFRPKGSMIDEATPPSEEDCWVLDTDSVMTNISDTDEFDAEFIAKAAGRLGDRAYAFFRWSTCVQLLDDLKGHEG